MERNTMENNTYTPQLVITNLMGGASSNGK